MTTTAFISYSHADDKSLERLHTHLAVLRRDGNLSAWYDHAILPGGHLDREIEAQLAKSELFLALVSPDYLASNYCYEKEFEHALKLADAGNLRIIPIILEPCDWLASPLSQFKALPKDGLPISEWKNQNNAFLNVTTGLRLLLDGKAERSKRESGTTEGSSRSQPPSSNKRPKIKRDFDAIDKADFADKTYEIIKGYFNASCDELRATSDDLRAKFENMSSTAFTCTVVNRGKRNGGEAHITVHNGKQRERGLGDITYVFARYAEINTANGFISVEADDYNLYLSMHLGFTGDREAKYAPEQAAALLWNEFVTKAGIEYE